MKARVSVIMPVAPGRSCARAIDALQRLPASEKPEEILTVSGTQPSWQRNIAAQRASGNFLYFLDNDSCVRPGTIARLTAALARTGAEAAGGPNVSERPASGLDGLCEAVLGSPLGSPLVYRRYAEGDGTPREAGEKSLILCNLMVRRSAFLELRGFDPRLYPNEENEFLNRLRAGGGRAVYVGNAAVTKRRSYSVAGFIRESWRYGRGRMEQVGINPHPGDAAFVVVAVSAAVIGAAAAANPKTLVLLAPYAAAVAAESVRLGRFRAVQVAALMVARHAAYLAGLICGVFSLFRRRGVRIRPMRVNLRKSISRGGRYRLKAAAMRFRIGFLSKEAS